MFSIIQGSFVVNMGTLMKGGTVKWTMLDTVKDTNTTSLYVYQCMVDIPE